MSEASTELQIEPERTELPSLFLNKNYVLLLLAQLVSDFGDGVYALGLLWGMKQLTGSGAKMSLVLTAEMIPLIALGLVAGVFVDYGRKKNFMLTADIFRAAITAGLFLLFYFGLIAPWMMIVAAASLASFSVFFTPARTIAIRSLVSDEQIMKAQSYSQTVQTIVGLCAPTVAAILMQYDVSLTFLFDAGSFLLSFLLLLWIRHPDLKTKQEGPINLKKVSTGLKQGFKTIATVPILRNLIVYMVLLNFMFAPVAVLLPIYANSATNLAVYETLFSIGVLGGALLVGFMTTSRKIIPLCLGIGLILISFGILSLVDGFYLACGCMLLLGLGSPIANITLSSLFVKKVPRDVLGRAYSTVRVFTQSASPVAMSLVGTVLIFFNVRELFQGIAVLGLVIVLAMVINPTVRGAE